MQNVQCGRYSAILHLALNILHFAFSENLPAMPSIPLTRGPLAYIDRGQGPPVLLVHGFPLDHTMWSAQIEALAAHARVIAPDLRGFGQSPLGKVDPQHGISMEQYADELAEFLDALNIAEPIILAGFSMGGYIAWQFVRKHGDRVRALIQCDTRAIADTDEGRAGRIKMAENVAEWGSARVAEIMGPKLLSAKALETRPELMAEIRRVVANTSPAAIAAAQRGMAARPDVTALLPSISVPTLILVGAEDAISTRDEMRKIADAIPNAEFVEIPASGHMTTMESPAALNKALAGFIARL
jgi:pimeloyl-ACP methyl ester carboxylesterase